MGRAAKPIPAAIERPNTQTREAVGKNKKKRSKGQALDRFVINGCKTRRFVSRRFLAEALRAPEDEQIYLLQRCRCIPGS